MIGLQKAHILFQVRLVLQYVTKKRVKTFKKYPDLYIFFSFVFLEDFMGTLM